MFLRRVRVYATALSLLVVILVPALARAVPDVGMPAFLAPLVLPAEDVAYPTLTASGTPGPPASWRVVSSASGNPYENYLLTTASGRILNFGGTRIRYSDDEGRRWTEVRADAPLLSAEGAIAATPDGGIVAATWSPYSGDRVVTYRYTPARGWRWMETVMHSPFFDRPWIGVIPGPVEVAGETYPFASVLAGGWPVQPRFVSLDGLTYLAPAGDVTVSLAGAVSLPTSYPLDTRTDYVTGHTRAGIVPLPGGGAVSTTSVGCRWALAQPNLRWACATPANAPKGNLIVDGAGRMHVFEVSSIGVFYSMSVDAGATWTMSHFSLPDGLQPETWDLRAHGSLGLSALAIHAHDVTQNTDVDLVLKFATGSGTPVLKRTYLLGEGDFDFAGGLNSTGADRFDLSSVGFLPDGRLVTSFADAAHKAAAVAIEL